MSELIQSHDARIRRTLLTTACTLALVASAPAAKAGDDADRPTLWIELGGQLEALSRSEDKITAPFLEELQDPGPSPFELHGFARAATRTLLPPPDSAFDPFLPLQAQKPPHYAFGGEGKISFAPKGSSWIFTASVRYGRSNGYKNLKQQTNSRLDSITNPNYHSGILAVPIARFTNTKAKYSETHAVVDFEVGKDVGLGLFGRGGESTLNFGVRFAQFTSRENLTVNALPNLQAYANHFSYPPFFNKYFYNTRFQTYAMTGHTARSFHGLGPSLSWNASAPLIGDDRGAEFTFDWGVNAALLFGRQRAKTAHKTSAYDRYHTYNFQYESRTTRDKTPHSTARSRTVTVPNVGGFAGLSLKFPNAKVSLGYRADYFFGAMDAGIDARHTKDMSFHGPFVKIGIGLGG
jgi:hypothetical protein